MEQMEFGRTSDGRPSFLYRMRNRNGLTLSVTDYGARLVCLDVPDRDGRYRDIVLGYDDLKGYEADGYCFGATIGRNANRIAGAKFRMNGREYRLSPNENGNNSHSGPDGYQDRIWSGRALAEDCVEFSLTSGHLDQGFPGVLAVSVVYTLTEDDAVRIQFKGVSDADTVINLTHHSYFNLDGHDGGTVLGQYLKIYAHTYSPVRDAQWIPTGEHAPVAATPMDFLESRQIGRDLGADFDQLRIGKGYNHNYILDKDRGEMGPAAQAYSAASGIRLCAYTDLPAMQLYTGGYLRAVRGKGGSRYDAYGGFCLEPQYVPNAVNEDGEEKPFFKAGEKYDRTVVYRVSVS